MEEKVKQEIQKIIVQLLKGLEIEIINFKELTKPISPDDAIGRLTRMEAISERAINLSTLRKAEGRVILLNDALVRIEHDDDFGICKSCDGPIPMGRMKLMPESLVCVSCIELAQSENEG